MSRGKDKSANHKIINPISGRCLTTNSTLNTRYEHQGKHNEERRNRHGTQGSINLRIIAVVGKKLPSRYMDQARLGRDAGSEAKHFQD